MDVDYELEVRYSGESESPSDSKSPEKPGPKAVGAGTTTAVPLAVAVCAMKCSVHPTSLSTRRGDRTDRARIRMVRVQNMKSLVIMMMSMALRGVIAAVAPLLRRS